jgi:phosphotransacetylase
MVEKVIDYEFSSDSNYRNNIYDVVDTDLILSILSKDKENAIEIYAEIMKSDKPIEKYVSKPKYKTDEVVIIEETKKLDEILAEICITKEIFTKIKEKNRSSVLTEYKVKYIQVSKHVGYTYEEIGRNIGISGNAAAMLIKRKDSYVN